MSRAALWKIIRLGCALIAAAPGDVLAAETGARKAPARPASATRPLPTKKFAGVDYVNAVDAAARLGLKFTWVKRGQQATFTGPNARAELEEGTRDIVVNGLRVFLGDPVVGSGGKLYVSRIDFERCLSPQLRPGFGVPAPRAPRTIVLDPGHGGRDHGTSTHEKTFALDVALRTKKLLEAGGFRVVLTRDDDVYVEHADRATIANTNQADAFVSIHFNALPNDSKTQGVEVYTFPPQNQRTTNSWSPGRKGDAEDEASPNNAQDHWNVVLAQALHRGLVQGLKSPDRGKKLMQLKVLRPLRCPGVLVECGFLTSEAEARKIATPAYRQQIAQVLADGIEAYAATVAGIAPKPTAASMPKAPATASAKKVAPASGQ